jgi:energy-coupling factor transport system permease protein
VAIVIPIIGGNLYFFLITIGISLGLLICGRTLRRALPLVAFSFTIIAVIFLVQGLFYHANETVLFALGKVVFYREGVLYATRIGCNILNMLLAFAVFVLTTSPQELVNELEKSGFSSKFGYIITSVFQIIPQMMKSKNTIMDAQRSRGMETEGKLHVRVKAFFPMISPVVMSALINTRERAIALEVRGFGRKNKKTYLTERAKYKGDKVAVAVLTLILVAVIVWRVVLCL